MKPRRSLGRMRHRLTLMAVTRAPDGGGGSSRADAVIGTVWARVQLASSRERSAYGQLQERVSHLALIRYREDVDQGSTVVWLDPGTDDPEVSSTDLPAGTPLYVLTAVDADPDGRPREFLQLALEARSTI